VLKSPTITLAMGNMLEQPLTQITGDPAMDPVIRDVIAADQIGFVDGVTAARVAALIESHGSQFEILRGGSLTLADLRKRPAVLIGLINNRWTLLLQGQLRFYFERDPSSPSMLLLDKQNPGKVVWRSVPSNEPYSRQSEDRAIISRFADKETEQIAILLAGCRREGTAAAGEFVTNPKYFALLAERLPAGWDRKNIEIVIATSAIQGNGGPPRIVATHIW
jgi:hypothetical protein